MFETVEEILRQLRAGEDTRAQYNRKRIDVRGRT